MASLQIINRRRQSVRNTRQITKAMQMVAASKLRRAQQAAMGPQAYTAGARELLRHLGAQTVAKTHPLFATRTVSKALTIIIAGDRGMAGEGAEELHLVLLEGPLGAVGGEERADRLLTHQERYTQEGRESLAGHEQVEGGVVRQSTR